MVIAGAMFTIYLAMSTMHDASLPCVRYGDKPVRYQLPAAAAMPSTHQYMLGPYFERVTLGAAESDTLNGIAGTTITLAPWQCMFVVRANDQGWFVILETDQCRTMMVKIPQCYRVPYAE